MRFGVIDFLKQHSKSDRLCLALVGLFVVLIMIPIPLIGIPDGFDLPQHMQFASTFFDAIRSGDFFPGWAATDNYGFGSIGIRYYPPVAYYLMAFTQMLTNDWYDSFWINSFFWMLIGCTGVYFWAKEWLSPLESVATAILYGVVPYHTAQIYQYMIFAEFAASGILPFCFLFSTRIIRRGRLADVLGFSISCSLLILTNIPVSIIGMIGLALYSVLMMDWKRPRKTIFNFSASLVLIILSTAFHWLRIVTEIAWVKHNSPQFSAMGFYDYKKNLFPMFYSAGEKYYEKMLWHLDITIIFTILLLVPVALFLVLNFKSIHDFGTSTQKSFVAITVVGFFACFMMSSASDYLWKSLSFLQKLQFPWRFLSLASLVGVMSFCLALRTFASHYPTFKRQIGYSALVLIVAILLFDITQNVVMSAPLSRAMFDGKLVKMGQEEGCRCWWPVWATASASGFREKILAGTRESRATRWESEIREFAVEKGEPQSLRVATFYHPHWRADVNGFPAEVVNADDGTILIPVGANAAHVKLYFEEPRKLKVALVISIATWIFLSFAIGTSFIHRKESVNDLPAIA